MYFSVLNDFNWLNLILNELFTEMIINSIMKKKLKNSRRQQEISLVIKDGNLTIYTGPEDQGKKEEKKQLVPKKSDINQPFPNLPSWNVIAIILSYYGPSDKVFELLH